MLLVVLNICIHIVLAAISARALSFMPRILIRRSFMLCFIHRLFLASIARLHPLLTLFRAPALRAPPLLHTPPSSFLFLVLVPLLHFLHSSVGSVWLPSSSTSLARLRQHRA